MLFRVFVPANWHKMSLMVKSNRIHQKRAAILEESWRFGQELAETGSSGSSTPDVSRPMISTKPSLLYIILINYIF